MNIAKCSILPNSMNGGKFPKGCPGAVWKNGNPSSTYCAGKDMSGNLAYPWWNDCCQWNGKECVPKSNI